MQIILWGLSFLSIIRAQSATDSTTSPTGTSTSSNIGDFIFVNPLDNTPNQLFPAGATFKIKWKISPDTLPPPPNITLAYRYGIWPDVSAFVNIADQIPYTDEYDWTIPANQFPSKDYILEISGPQTAASWIRSRTSDDFQIYQPTTVVNGQIVLPAAGEKNSANMLLALAFALISYMLW